MADQYEYLNNRNFEMKEMTKEKLSETKLFELIEKLNPFQEAMIKVGKSGCISEAGMQEVARLLGELDGVLIAEHLNGGSWYE